MENHNHNLNIHYSLPDEIWDKVVSIYPNMPYWGKFVNGCPMWDNTNDSAKFIEASVEPSGLQFYAEFPKEEWDAWFNLFKEQATKALGYTVGEPEEGFDFIYDLDR